MCFHSPKAPAAPDYAAAATAQGVANQNAATQTAVISNPNIVSPYGNQNVTWSDTGAPGGNPQATVTQTLTPEAQATLEAQQRVQHSFANLGETGINNAQNTLSQSFNPNLPNIQTGLNTSGVAAMPVNAGTTGQAAIMARLQPQIQQQQAAMAQQLANQGITPGSEAYNNAMRTQGQQQNDMLQQAALQGLNLDMAANNQGYNQALQSGQFGNTALQQSLAQQMALRNQPINEVTALMSGSQIQNPQFQAYTGANVAAAPVFQGVQAQNQAAMDLYGIKQGAANANMQGITSALGTAAMAFSDVRLKSNIERIGTHERGFGIYEYDIFDRHEIGVLAQEVEQIMPEAVAEHASGFKMVNYGIL
jgi:hypothetical protein